MTPSIHIDDTHVVHVQGEVDLSTAAALRDRIDHARRDGGDTSVIIDLAGVTFIDSAGLCELVRPATQGYAVTLRRTSPTALRVLEVAGVTEVFTLDD
jgi:anti-sigma B factor antagonist